MAKGSGGGVTGRSGYRRVARDLNAGREGSYRGPTGKSYRAQVEERKGLRYLTIRGSGNRRLASRKIGRNTIDEFALNVAAGW